MQKILNLKQGMQKAMFFVFFFLFVVQYSDDGPAKGLRICAGCSR